MGAAKNRGTFEQRKAEALEAGRVKTPTKSINRIVREHERTMLYEGNLLGIDSGLVYEYLNFHKGIK